MQQKKVGNKLYVLDMTPYVITQDTDAEIIYVQQEKLAGYIELNPTLADKITTINYLVYTVQKKEWASEDDGGGTDDTPPVEVSIVVNEDTVNASYAYDAAGYSFEAKSFTTSPTGYEQDVTITVGEAEYVSGMILTAGTYTVTYTLADGDDYEGDTVSYSVVITQQAAPTQVSIVVNEDTVNASYAYDAAGYSFEAKSFTTSPTGYEQDVVITVGANAYVSGMSLTEGTYTVTYTLADGNDYLGDTASYSVVVTQQAAPTPEPTPQLTDFGAYADDGHGNPDFNEPLNFNQQDVFDYDFPWAFEDVHYAGHVGNEVVEFTADQVTWTTTAQDVSFTYDDVTIVNRPFWVYDASAVYPNDIVSENGSPHHTLTVTDQTSDYYGATINYDINLVWYVATQLAVLDAQDQETPISELSYSGTAQDSFKIDAVYAVDGVAVPASDIDWTTEESDLTFTYDSTEDAWYVQAASTITYGAAVASYIGSDYDSCDITLDVNITISNA